MSQVQILADPFSSRELRGVWARDDMAALLIVNDVSFGGVVNLRPSLFSALRYVAHILLRLSTIKRMRLIIRLYGMWLKQPKHVLLSQYIFYFYICSH